MYKCTCINSVQIAGMCDSMNKIKPLYYVHCTCSVNQIQSVQQICKLNPDTL